MTSWTPEICKKTIYLTPHEVHVQRSAKWGRRQEALLDKEQGRDRQKLSDWLGPHSSPHLG